MTIAALLPMPKFREFTNAGAPANGYKLYTAQPGTVAGPTQSYPKSTYTSSDASVANTNPVVLDAYGRASVWLSGSYSMALYDAAGVLIWSVDNVNSNSSAAPDNSVQRAFCDATLAAFNLSIPAANDLAAPTYYEVIKTDTSANPVVITPTTGTIDGSASHSLWQQKECARFTKNPDENNWYRLS